MLRILLLIGCVGWAGALFPAWAQESFDPVRDAIAAMNADELARHFHSSVTVSLDGPAQTFSKTQARATFQKFFEQRPVQEFTIKHTGSSSNGALLFALGRYTSGTQKYSVIIRARIIQKTLQVHEISFTREER